MKSEFAFFASKAKKKLNAKACSDLSKYPKGSSNYL